MDPNACLRMILEFLAEGDEVAKEQAVWSLEDLTDWLAKGGYAPNWLDEIRRAIDGMPGADGEETQG